MRNPRKCCFSVALVRRSPSLEGGCNNNLFKGGEQAGSKRSVHFAFQPLLSLLSARAQGKDQSPEDFSKDLLMTFGFLR